MILQLKGNLLLDVQRGRKLPFVLTDNGVVHNLESLDEESSFERQSKRSTQHLEPYFLLKFLRDFLINCLC